MKKGVSIIIENELGEVLCVSRKPDHTQWGLPGGKVEENESLVEAVMRELQEETGYELPMWKWLLNDTHNLVYAVYQYGYMNYTYYINPVYADKIIIKPEEGYLVEWRSWDDLINNSPFSDYNKQAHDSYRQHIAEKVKIGSNKQ
jgi:8-oxo-dGTP pyrophosphatase MutT (NUDIX family)